MSGEYYVYAHVRPDTNEVFYIGKGTGKRAQIQAGRNERWTRTVAKVKTYSIIYLEKGLTHEAACQREQFFIAAYKSKSLVNMTAGGEGVKGLSPEAVIRKSIALKATKALSKEYRKQRVKQLFDSRPDIRKKLSEAKKIEYSDPEARKRMSLAVLASVTSESRIRRSEAALLRWKKQRNSKTIQHNENQK